MLTCTAGTYLPTLICLVPTSLTLRGLTPKLEREPLFNLGLFWKGPDDSKELKVDLGPRSVE